MRSSVDNNLLRDTIRMQKGTEAKEFCCRKIRLFYLFKRQGPCRRNGFGMICRQSPAPFQQCCSASTIVVLIVCQTTSCLFNIGSCLIEGQWQSTDLLGDGSGQREIGG